MNCHSIEFDQAHSERIRAALARLSSEGRQREAIELLERYAEWLADATAEYLIEED